MKRRIAIAGVVSGAAALALLLAQTRMPLVPVMALAAPLAGGAVAALIQSRGEGRELSVDEAVSAGARVGWIGGFIVSVPFPLALQMFLADPPRGPLGLGVTIAIGFAVLLVFLVLSIVAAVVAARIHGARSR